MSRKNGQKTGINGAQTVGIILFVFSVVVFLCLLSGGALFGGVGKAINSFVIGSMGYFSFAFFVLLGALGVGLFSGLKPTFKAKTVVMVSLMLLFAMLALQLVTAGGEISEAESASEFASLCYDRGANGFGSATAGGALFGWIVYPLYKIFGMVGCYIVFALLFFLAALAAINFRKVFSYRKESDFAPRSGRERGYIDYDLSGIPARPNYPAQGGGYASAPVQREMPPQTSVTVPQQIADEGGKLFVTDLKDSPIGRKKRQQSSAPAGYDFLLNNVEGPVQSAPVQQAAPEPQGARDLLFPERKDRAQASERYNIVSESPVRREAPSAQQPVYPVQQEQPAGRRKSRLFSDEDPKPVNDKSYLDQYSDRESVKKLILTPPPVELNKGSAPLSKRSSRGDGELPYDRIVHNEPLSSQESNFSKGKGSNRVLDNQIDILNGYENYMNRSREESSRKSSKISDAKREEYRNFLSMEPPKDLPPIITGHEKDKDEAPKQPEKRPEVSETPKVRKRDMFGGYEGENVAPDRPPVIDDYIPPKIERNQDLPGFFNGPVFDIDYGVGKGPEETRKEEAPQEPLRFESDRHPGMSRNERKWDEPERSQAEMSEPSIPENRIPKEDFFRSETPQHDEPVKPAVQPEPQPKPEESPFRTLPSKAEKDPFVHEHSDEFYEEKLPDGFYENSQGKLSIPFDEFGQAPEPADGPVNKFKPIFSESEPEPAKPEAQEEEEFRNPPKIDMAPYQRPPLDLLMDRYTEEDDTKAREECEEKAAMLEKTLEDFRIPAKVVNITIGPTVTRYELQMPAGISVSKVSNLTDDIAMCLSTDGAVRIEAPIPGKNLFGIEIPNSTRRTVGLREIVDSREFEGNSSPVAFALGKGISGENVICDIAKMPHLLIAGTTGSGKSVCLNTIILSILYKSSPEDVRIILIDPKRVEFSMFEGLPNLMLKNIITEPEKAIAALNWAITEMNYRFEVFKRNGVKDIASYNARIDPETEQKFCRIVIIIDELAELMMGKNKQTIEDNIKRLTQLSRAAGIHLVVATQRPSVDVITGVIKSNMPSRIAFSVSSQVDSRTVLDQIGAESLIGYGDMLYARQDMKKPMRLQGPFVSSDEVEAVVNYVRDHNETYYDQSVEDKINAENRKEEPEADSTPASGGGGGNGENAKLLPRILKMGIERGSLSISMVQRSFEMGYARAGKMIDELEKLGYISEFEGAKSRKVLITKEEFAKLFPDVE